MLDATDLRILRQFQAAPDLPTAVLADRAGVTPTTLARRIDKTQPRAFDEFLAAAREVPEVIEAQTFLGQVDARLSVIARDMPHYQQVYRDKLLTLPHIADVEALMHVARVKFNETLPL